MTWNDGYIVDAAYTDDAFSIHTPMWISLISLLNGQEPLDMSRPITYVELGCGNGLTAAVVAAANASTNVWACDFNPAHIHYARRRVDSANLTNCRFEERSFEELANDPTIGPARVDIIVLHGVFSWVSDQNRRYVMRYINDHLAPGGFVLVTYNSSHGWAAAEPLREFIRVHAETDKRASSHSVAAAVASLVRLEREGASLFPLPAPEQQMFEALPSKDPAYLAHEYLAGSFQPFSSNEMAEIMREAKCEFIGSVLAPTALPTTRLPLGLQDFVRYSEHQELFELICDFAVGTTFRQDLFRRGYAPLGRHSFETSLNQLQLIGLDPAKRDAVSVATPSGSIEVEAAELELLFAQLGNSPVALGQLRQACGAASAREWMPSLIALIESRVLAPAVETISPDTRDACNRLNRYFVERARVGSPAGMFVSPVLGIPLAKNHLSTLVLGEIWDGADLSIESLQEIVKKRIDPGVLQEAVSAFIDGSDDSFDDALKSACAGCIGLAQSSYLRFEIYGGPSRDQKRQKRQTKR